MSLDAWTLLERFNVVICRERENVVIPARMPESSAMDGNSPIAHVFDLSSVKPKVCHPWTLDSGIPAGMTGFGIDVYNNESRAWERAEILCVSKPQ